MNDLAQNGIGKEPVQERTLTVPTDTLIHQIICILQRNPDEQFLRLALTKIVNLEKVMCKR